jgi:DNA-directed RNA polymerase subunit RPC12/RpoP
MADFIDRKKIFDFKDGHLTPFEIEEFLCYINDIPKADVVEVKHGKWIIKTDDYDCEYMKCSCCGQEFYPTDEDTVDKTPNYCPDCGAKMDGDYND